MTKLKFWIIYLVALLPGHGCAENNSSAPYAGLVDIGGGRQIYMDCNGTGSPAVVLVSGLSNRAEIWRRGPGWSNKGPNVFAGVAAFTRSCAYDRPAPTAGDRSRSTPVARSTSVKDGVNDLHALLAAAKVPLPYVLVGHSFGGLIVRLYASTYPDEVAGLVLIDALSEFLYDTLPFTQRALWTLLNSQITSQWERYPHLERTDFLADFDELRQAPALRPIPSIVITSDKPLDFSMLIARGRVPADTPTEWGAAILDAHRDGQKRLAEVLNAKHITDTQAGHYIHIEQPQLVIDAIREVVDKVRSAKK